VLSWFNYFLALFRFSVVLQKKRSAWILLFVVLASSLLNACGLQPFQPLDNLAASLTVPAYVCTLKIGVIINTTLPQAAAIRAAYELGQAEINAGDGVNGCQILLLLKEDQNTSEGAVAAMRELIDKEQVLLALASTSDEIALELAQEAENRHLPLILAHNTNMIITQMGYQWVFRLASSSETMLEIVFDWLQNANGSLPPPSLLSIYPYEPAGDALQSMFLVRAAQRGWSVLDGLTYRHGQKEYNMLLSAVRTINADVLFIFGGREEDLSLLLQQMADMRIRPKALILFTGSFTDLSFLTGAQFNVEGVVTVAQWAEQLPWKEKNGRNATEFFRTLSNQSPQVTDYHALQAYTALLVAEDVLTKVLNRGRQNITPRLQGALQSYNTSDSLWGSISFAANGQNNHDVILLQRQERQFEVIYPVSYRTKPHLFPLPHLKDEQ